MKKMNTMTKLYNSRAFWLIIALLASLSIWLYVTSQETEDYKQTFRGVQVVLVGEDILRDSKNMVITDLSTETVTVEISGPRRIVGAWNSEDLVAQVDVSKLGQSGYKEMQYTIKFPDRTDTSDVRTSSKTPETLNFTLSAMTQKTFTVEGSFNGNAAEGYTLATGMPKFEPETITVYGPEKYLEGISRVWVEFGAQDITSTYSVETGFTLRNKDNEECSTVGLTFSQDTVIATEKVLTLKEIPLNVNLTYAAGANETNTKVTIEPESITLSGDSALFDGLNMITLDNIDLSKFDSTYTDTILIRVPDGLNNVSGENEAKVTVEIDGLETKSFSVGSDNISCINVTEGYEAEVLTNYIVIKLRGTPELLAQIKSENIRVIVDLKDYNTTVGPLMASNVKITIDGFTDVGAIGDYKDKILIEIRRVEQ